ncbi:MAG: hypothetical protein J2P15_05455 [Micromonosporaceae bacterium]|nr:hypothetical protein [Micromonosporaceae bacterium]
MTEPGDGELLARLARILAEVEPVPEPVLAAADAAIGTRDPDAELADLIADSTAGRAGGYEPVRHAGTSARLLSFDGGGLRVELEVLPDDGTLTLLGQVFGAARECALESGGGQSRPVELDELGRFLVGGLATGPVRLSCRSATARVVTSWVTL